MTTYTNRRQTREGAWFVTEVGDDGLTCNVMLLSENDPTAGIHFQYDPRCSMCWLGYGHSQLFHRNRINKALSR